jgi:hypothetical protein
MQLAGVLLAGLSVLQLSVNWYIATTEEFDEKKL